MQERRTGAPGFVALGDATRAEIVRLLLESDDHALTVGRLTESLALRQPTVSYHLRLLHDAGVVAREPRGREVWYSLPESVASRLHEWSPVMGESSISAALLGRIIDDLTIRFTGTFSRETVHGVVLDSYDLLRARSGEARALPSATAQFASERLSAHGLMVLRDTAENGGPSSSGARKPGSPVEVLFICVQNAGRSQLAAAIMRHLGGDRVRVRTAGSAPIDSIRPTVVTALDEIGVPLGGEFPKPLTDDVVRASDVIVTMGCGDACPVYPGRRYLDWSVSDPAGQPLDRVREIRDDIDARVRALLEELVSVSVGVIASVGANANT